MTVLLVIAFVVALLVVLELRRWRQPGVCRECGCSDYRACVHSATLETCHWTEPDLCSACAYGRDGWEGP